MTETKRRIRDHELLCDLFCIAEQYVELLERIRAPDACEKREVLRAIKRENTLGHVLGT
jgi:hypothetical protein